MYQRQIFVEAVCKRDGSVYLKPLGKPRRVLPIGVYGCEYISKGKRCYAKMMNGCMVDEPWRSYKIVA